LKPAGCVARARQKDTPAIPRRRLVWRGQAMRPKRWTLPYLDMFRAYDTALLVSQIPLNHTGGRHDSKRRDSLWRMASLIGRLGHLSRHLSLGQGCHCDIAFSFCQSIEKWVRFALSSDPNFHRSAGTRSHAFSSSAEPRTANNQLSDATAPQMHLPDSGVIPRSLAN
jgi:hypothetical protein